MLNSYGWVGGGLQDFIVSPSPLWVNFGFELGWTELGFGLGELGNRGTRVLGLGLDNPHGSRSAKQF